MNIKRNHKASITTIVLDALRSEICNNTYADGQFITEAEISQKYSVSKTPAREALTILCQENLLYKIPRKGYMVKKLTLKELQNLYQFRNILERAGVEYAVRYASDEDLEELARLANVKILPTDADWVKKYLEANTAFHIFIARLTQNDYLIDALLKVLNVLQRDLIEDMKAMSVEKTLDAHKLIVAAMKERDLEKALRISSEQINIIERRNYLH